MYCVGRPSEIFMAGYFMICFTCLFLGDMMKLAHIDVGYCFWSVGYGLYYPLFAPVMYWVFVDDARAHEERQILLGSTYAPEVSKKESWATNFFVDPADTKYSSYLFTSLPSHTCSHTHTHT